MGERIGFPRANRRADDALTPTMAAVRSADISVVTARAFSGPRACCVRRGTFADGTRPSPAKRSPSIVTVACRIGEASKGFACKAAPVWCDESGPRAPSSHPRARLRGVHGRSAPLFSHLCRHRATMPEVIDLVDDDFDEATTRQLQQIADARARVDRGRAQKLGARAAIATREPRSRRLYCM